jgi:hypothetical protein
MPMKTPAKLASAKAKADVVETMRGVISRVRRVAMAVTAFLALAATGLVASATADFRTRQRSSASETHRLSWCGARTTGSIAVMQ